jgi:hypothetical protein
MASVYGYLTLANLENYMGIDLSAVDSVALSDARVEFHITSAEEYINALLGVSAAQTITNAITIATKWLSAYSINHILQGLGYGVASDNPIYDWTWKELITEVKTILTSDTGVDSIPMSGADRYSSSYSPYWR